MCSNSCLRIHLYRLNTVFCVYGCVYLFFFCLFFYRMSLAITYNVNVIMLHQEAAYISGLQCEPSSSLSGFELLFLKQSSTINVSQHPEWTILHKWLTYLITEESSSSPLIQFVKYLRNGCFILFNQLINTLTKCCDILFSLLDCLLCIQLACYSYMHV